MAVDELLKLIDSDEEPRQVISDEAFQSIQESDPEFIDKMIMSNVIGSRNNVNASEIFDNYEASSKAYGYSGNAALDRAAARADLKKSQQYGTSGFWESEVNAAKRGGVRVGQFGDSLSILQMQHLADIEKRRIEWIRSQPIKSRTGSEWLGAIDPRNWGNKGIPSEEIRDKWIASVENKVKELEGRRNEQIVQFATKQAKLMSIPMSKRLAEFRSEEGDISLLINPATFTEFITEEIVASAPTLLAITGGTIAAGPVGGSAGAGTTDYARGVSSGFFEYLSESGVDITDQAAIKTAIDNKDLFDSALEHGMIKAAPEAIASALSVGVAAKGNAVFNALAVQPGIAGAGVVASQLIVGEDIDMKELASEMLAELGVGSVEVMASRMLNRSDAFKDKTVSASGQPMNANEFAIASESVDLDAHTEGMKVEEALLVEKARNGDTRAVGMSERLHEADSLAEGIGIRGDAKFVGLSKVEINRTREAQGLDPLSDPDVQSMQSQIDLAKQEGLDAKALELADEILSNPRQLSTTEFGGFVLKKAQLQNEIDALDIKIIEGNRAGNDVSRFEAQQRIAEENISKLDSASARSGTVGARAQNMRRAMLNTEDFSLGRLLNKAEAAKGSPLTKAEENLFNKLSKEIEGLKKNIRRQNALIKSLGEGRIDQKAVDELVRLKVLDFKAKAAAKKKIREISVAQRFRRKGVFGKGVAGVVEIVTASRTLKTIGDVSSWLRQGGFLLPGAPISGLKAMKKSLQTVFSEQKFIETDILLREMPQHVEREASNLYLSPVDRIDLSVREEAFASNLVEATPGLRQIAFASERNMATYLNLLRVAKFDSFIANHPEATQIEKDAYAAYINAATGRGSLFGFERSARELSLIFFAPRFAASRIEHAFRSANLLRFKETRVEVIKDWAAFAATGISVLSLAALAGAEVGDDPLSSDFGKIVTGDTRVDIWAGFQQPFRLVWGYGAKGADTAGIKELEKDIDITDATLRFLLYKAAPTVTIPAQILEGEDVVGKEKDLIETGIESITPLFLGDTWEVFKNTGSVEKAIATMGLTAVGIGVTEQAPRDDRATTRPR